MLNKEEILKNMEIGQTIFNELFALSDEELKEKLISILRKDYGVLSHKPDCIRTIRNSVPDSIEFWFYDCVKINLWGIYFQPEHGKSEIVVHFNEHFKI